MAVADCESLVRILIRLNEISSSIVRPSYAIISAMRPCVYYRHSFAIRRINIFRIYEIRLLKYNFLQHRINIFGIKSNFNSLLIKE